MCHSMLCTLQKGTGIIKRNIRCICQKHPCLLIKMTSLNAGEPSAALVKYAHEKATLTLESKQPRNERLCILLSYLRDEMGGRKKKAISSHLSAVYGRTALGDAHEIHEGMKPVSRKKFETLINNSDGYSGPIPFLCVAGWCKTVRMQNAGRLGFVILNDGSCKANLQIIVHEGAIGHELVSKCSSGTVVRAYGILVERPQKDPSQGSSKEDQTLEMVSNQYELHVCNLQGHSIEVVGQNCDPAKYPIAKKYMSHEFLRDVAHLRSRSYFISAVMRVRSTLALATHIYFQRLGCIYLNTPLITASDCEGAGELFQVTTMLENCKNLGDIAKKMGHCDPKEVKTIEEMELDYKKDFFKRKAFLTCSGQLSAESYACSMGKVYTFGPTFRAEHSHTYRHLAEFWMVEPEIDFCDLAKNMDIAEEYIKFAIQYTLEHCMDDLMFLESTEQPGLVENLHSYISGKFMRITYTDVVDILMKHETDFQADLLSKEQNKVEGKEATVPRMSAFENHVEWGIDLSSEHERFIAESVFKKPTIIYNYPSKIKAFYMRRNDDGKTCAAMDIIVPRFGELVGGSQREERREVLEASIMENGLSPEDYSWYIDLRTYGSIPHSGFGLGFERLVMLVTGVSNIRDVIPFPRYMGRADF